MKMNYIDIWLWEAMKADSNPMMTIGEVCRRLHRQWGQYGDGSVQDSLYSTVRRSVAKFEDFGLIYVYRVVNGGTVFMSKERATKGVTND